MTEQSRKPAPGQSKDWHGKTSGYRHHKCRCESCTKTSAELQKSYRAKKYADRYLRFGRMYHPDAPHGTKGGYTNYGCRCSECSVAVKRGVA